MKLNHSILAYDIALYKSCVFYSSRIRTLVAMATDSFNRLIMGKVDLGKDRCRCKRYTPTFRKARTNTIIKLPVLLKYNWGNSLMSWEEIDVPIFKKCFLIG